MNDNLSYFSKIDNLFDRIGTSSEGIIALFVNTNNASQKFMVCCRKDDTIKGLCKRIANIYYKIYCGKSGGEEDEDDYNHDKLYENIENKQIRVPYLTQDYYLLPGFHRVGDLLRDYSQVTANIVEVANSKENIISPKSSPKKQRKFNGRPSKVEDVEEDSEDEEIKENVSKKLKTDTGETNIAPSVVENNEGNSKNQKKKKQNKVPEESQKSEEISQIIEEKGQKEESKKKKKNHKSHHKKEAIEEKGENLIIEEEEKSKAGVNKKLSQDMKGYTMSGENKNKERKVSKEVESSSEDDENEHADKKLMKGIEAIAKKEKGFNVFCSDEESSEEDKKLKKEGKSAKKGTNQSRSK